MSILIKGMEMPTSCDDCILNNGITCYAVPDYKEDGVVGRTDDRPDWCPLVPVPPHGRLIEDVAVREQIDEWLDSVGDVVVGRGLSYYGELLGCIEDTPTIIPAEPFNNLSKPCKDDEDIPICTKASPASLGIYKKAEEGE